MPFVWALLLVVGAAVYLVYAALAILIAGVIAAAVYGVGVPVMYLIGLGEALLVQPPSVSRAARRGAADPAVPQYFYGPAWADAKNAMRVAYDQCQIFLSRGKRKVTKCFFAAPEALATVPAGLGGAAGMAVGATLGAIAAGGLALIQLLVVAVSAAGMRATGAALRRVDSAVLAVKHIRMTCPNCGRRVHYPGYECPKGSCRNRHRDVRPGRLGIIRRYCWCGQPMNTLLLFGSSRMTAVCPGCHQSFEHRPGEAPEIVLPFFGAAGAGKTRLLCGIVTQFRIWNRAELLKADFGDSVTERELKAAEDIVCSKNILTPKTLVRPPRSYLIDLRSARSTRLLQTFDAAGEFFTHPGRTRGLRYLDKARTYILVIDPLSIDPFWHRLPASRQQELNAVRSTLLSPDLAYQQTLQEIEAMGLRLRQTRLAVVFSRADLIDLPDGDVRNWAAHELGLGNLVRSTCQSFKETQFFLTAAILSEGVMHESVATLIRWVLGHDGLDLPGGTP